jgi:hypothetical protein
MAHGAQEARDATRVAAVPNAGGQPGEVGVAKMALTLALDHCDELCGCVHGWLLAGALA